MTTTDYVPVDALKLHILNMREYYKELQSDCKKWRNETSFHIYQGVLKALNELEEQIDEMKVSI